MTSSLELHLRSKPSNGIGLLYVFRWWEYSSSKGTWPCNLHSKCVRRPSEPRRYHKSWPLRQANIFGTSWCLPGYRDWRLTWFPVPRCIARSQARCSPRELEWRCRRPVSGRCHGSWKHWCSWIHQNHSRWQRSHHKAKWIGQRSLVDSLPWLRWKSLRPGCSNRRRTSIALRSSRGFPGILGGRTTKQPISVLLDVN